MLVIDPTLVFGTFTGSRTSNWGYTATPALMAVFLQGVLFLVPDIRYQLVLFKVILVVEAVPLIWGLPVQPYR